MRSYSSIMLSVGETNEKFLEVKRHNYGALLKAQTPGNVLEIGPGNGEFIKLVKEINDKNKIYCVDLDEEIIDLVKIKFKEINAIKVDQNDMISEKFNVEFKLIIMSHVLEHINLSKRIDYIKDLHKTMAEDSVLIIEYPNAFFPIGGMSAYFSDPTHENPLTSSGAMRMLKLAGFNVVEVNPLRVPLKFKFIFSNVKIILGYFIGIFINKFSGTNNLFTPVFYLVAYKN
jgi:2-polyprenyl-3-methyl-5-hydroxy-6-metoxy-1,4-benzoquinol methylase